MFLRLVASYIRLFHVIPFHLATSWKASHLVCPASDYSCNSYCHGILTTSAGIRTRRSKRFRASFVVSKDSFIADEWLNYSSGSTFDHTAQASKSEVEKELPRICGFSVHGYRAPSSFGRWIWQRLSILPALASSHTPGTWSYWHSRCSPCSLATRIMIVLHNMTTVRYCKYI